MATTLVGGALLSASFNVLLDRLTPDLIKFFGGRKHEEMLLRELKLKLLGLSKVLDDAEDKHITHQAVKDWVDELKDAVYDAEDLVDEIATEVLRCKVQAEYQNGPNQVQSLISSIAYKLFNDTIESKLRGMIDRLEDFSKTKDALGLREVAGRNVFQTRLLTDSVVVESCVFGRENDRVEIMKKLLLSDGEGRNNFDVVPIVGMGGVGKTTLAKLLYNDHRLDRHFVKKAWVCVSDVFDVERVRVTIVEEVTGMVCDRKDPNSLATKLKESLSGIKFLIVLDDVWYENYEHWDALMTPFKFGARGSKIIVTTRDDNVASIIPQSIPIHRLHVLPEEHCWEVFSQHAFGKEDQYAHPTLEKIGREIVKKCKGLPLAAKTLGGLLRSERDEKGWDTILKSAIWELSEAKSNILPALRLSYRYLPSQLKRCFAYCSIFSKGYEFDMKELVSFWMAEGFLAKPKNNRTVEEEGYQIFRELLSRSFFQRSNASDYLFVMHDLVHDLAQYVMGDSCYWLGDDHSQVVADKVRHFSCNHDCNFFFKKFEGLSEIKCLRTFEAKCLRTFLNHSPLLECEMDVNYILSRSTRLRLLSLKVFKAEGLLHSIGNMIHLRLLDLSNTGIKELPESICTLYNLERLLLSGNWELTTLPANLVKLISLRHLDLSRTSLNEMPMHMCRLKDLQELTIFVVGKCSGLGIDELGEFHCLGGNISISKLENVKSGHDALGAKMSEKRYLERLALEWNGTIEDSQNARDVLEKLKPHTNLKHLVIKNYGGTNYPTWLGDQAFCNMISLHLRNCENCFSLPPLGQMPFLKELIIESMPGIRSVGCEFYGESDPLRKPFQSLETLRFEDMSELEEWCILDRGEFSQLQKLEVRHCPNLIVHLPTKMPCLVELYIFHCLGLEASLSRATSTNELEASPSSFTSLEQLEVGWCDRLKYIQLSLFPKLRSLHIWYCGNFEALFVPDGIEHRNFTLLKELLISNCPNMLYFPCGGLQAPNLSSLDLESCEKLKALPEQMHTLLPSLQSLRLWFCPEIESFPEGSVLPSRLSNLEIIHCDKLVDGRRDWGLQKLPSLTSFTLQCKSEDMESFPEEGLLPSSLSVLYFADMPNLKSLDERGLQLLGSLQHMTIQDCPQLQSLSAERLPASLSKLEIERCPLLMPRCCREDGEDWHKIAHIPSIEIKDDSHQLNLRNFLLSISSCRITEPQVKLLFDRMASKSRRPLGRQN